MSLHLYDTASRGVRAFTPLREGEVSIYHCGLTVQSAPHLGHVRKEVAFDVLRRWLTRLGYRVRIVANVTDIDDKILRKSAEQKKEWYELGYEVEQELHRAYEALGMLPLTYEPRATGHIPEMIALMQRLIDAGHAYAADGSVYFDVKSWPRYGELSNQKIDEMVEQEDTETRGKRDPRDFALWKAWKEGEPLTASWETPWGRGRPGWHLECTAMACKYLDGEFDIHGGGLDLRFPHHENELAQAAAAGYGFARFWLHNAWLTMAGEKMSKSLGNVALVTEVCKQYSPRAVRLYLSAPHYRSHIEFSLDSLAEAEASLARIDSFLARAKEQVGAVLPGDLPPAFVDAMNDDLGTPAAFACLYSTVKEGNQALERGQETDITAVYRSVIGMLDVLGLNPDAPEWAAAAGGGTELKPLVDELISELLKQRQEARARKDYAAADAIRDRLAGLGVAIEDTAQGARWSLH